MSSPGMTKSAPVILLVVEGRDDGEFFNRLVNQNHDKLNANARWVIHGVGGKDRFRAKSTQRRKNEDSLDLSSPKSFIENFGNAILLPKAEFPAKRPVSTESLDNEMYSNGNKASFEELTHIALICDADDKGRRSGFDKLQKVFEDLNRLSKQISVPASHGVWTQGAGSHAKQSGVFVMTGPDDKGSLEDLMLATAEEKFRACIDSFFACAQIENPKSKQRMQAYLTLRQASYCDLARSFQKGSLWPLGNSAFKPLLDFLSLAAPA